MKLETYQKYREEFLNKYKVTNSNELGFVALYDIRVHNFDKFLFLFSYDIVSATYNNITNSVNNKQYYIRDNKPVVSIKIIEERSLFDKYPDTFHSALKTYKLK